VDLNLRKMRKNKDAKKLQQWKIETHVGVSDVTKKRRERRWNFFFP
jgi:hypothetical protein